MPNFLTKAPRLTMSVGKRFLHNPSEAILMCEIAGWVAVTSMAAQFFSLPRALQFVSTTKRANATGTNAQQEQLARVVDLVLSADVLMFRPVCWKRAAVLHRFLAKQGVETTIRFGVRPPKGKAVAGHAWLERNGKAILEKEPPDYIVTYTFPSNEKCNLQLATLSHK